MTTFYGGQPGHLAEHDRLAAFTTDTGIAALVTAGGPTEAALNATYGPAGTAGNLGAASIAPLTKNLALGPRWVFDGDSISVAIANGAWINEMVSQSGGRIKMIANPAVAGRTTTQALIDFETNIRPLAGQVDVVCYEEWSHSMSQGLTPAQFTALLDQYLAKVTSIGARMVMVSVFPNASLETTQLPYEAALLAWTQRNSIPFIPMYTLADPATGNYQTGWSTDGTHPDPYGVGTWQFGALAWQSVSGLMGAPAIPFANFNGDSLAANGFGLTAGAPVTGTVTALALVATSGTLPAGTYSYRAVTANYVGKSATYQQQSITLASTGGVGTTITTSGSYSFLRVYRKGPSDSTYGLVYSGTSKTWTDDGTVAAGAFAWADGDYSAFPAVWGIGTNLVQADIPRTAQIAGIRGNAVQLPPAYNAGTFAQSTNWVDYNVPITAGQSYEVTFKFRANITAAPPLGSGSPAVRLQFYTGSTATGPSYDRFKQYVTTDVHQGHWVGTAPTGADTLKVRLSDNGIAHNGVAIGELYVNPVSS